jgi:hypothetical protein
MGLSRALAWLVQETPLFAAKVLQHRPQCRPEKVQVPGETPLANILELHVIPRHADRLPPSYP